MPSEARRDRSRHDRRGGAAAAVVDCRDLRPLVDRGAGVRDPEPDEVAHGEGRLGSERDEGVLVVEPRHDGAVDCALDPRGAAEPLRNASSATGNPSSSAVSRRPTLRSASSGSGREMTLAQRSSAGWNAWSVSSRANGGRAGSGRGRGRHRSPSGARRASALPSHPGGRAGSRGSRPRGRSRCCRRR